MMDDGVKAEKENRTKNSHGTHTHTHTHTQHSGSFPLSRFKHGMVIILTFLYVLNAALSK